MNVAVFQDINEILVDTGPQFELQRMLGRFAAGPNLLSVDAVVLLTCTTCTSRREPSRCDTYSQCSLVPHHRHRHPPLWTGRRPRPPIALTSLNTCNCGQARCLSSRGLRPSVRLGLPTSASDGIRTSAPVGVMSPLERFHTARPEGPRSHSSKSGAFSAGSRYDIGRPGDMMWPRGYNAAGPHHDRSRDFSVL